MNFDLTLGTGLVAVLLTTALLWLPLKLFRKTAEREPALSKEAVIDRLVEASDWPSASPPQPEAAAILNSEVPSARLLPPASAG